jgi:hypothetical protein
VVLVSGLALYEIRISLVLGAALYRVWPFKYGGHSAIAEITQLCLFVFFYCFLSLSLFPFLSLPLLMHARHVYLCLAIALALPSSSRADTRGRPMRGLLKQWPIAFSTQLQKSNDPRTINVLDYGADPSGETDSSAGAVSRREDVAPLAF